MGSPLLSSYANFGTGAAFSVVTRRPKTRTGYLVGPAKTPNHPYELKVAENQEERAAAFKLVHDAYVRAGLMTSHSMGMRVMKHHLSDRTDVLVVKRAGKVVFTSTLVRDGEFGLPLESLFSAEVQEMREQGLQIAEVSCLASDRTLEDKTQRFELFVELIGLLFQNARFHGVDRVLLAVHPRHAKVHQRMFGCELCSDVKEYAAVEGNPAVLCSHDFARLDQTRYCLYEKVYRKTYGVMELLGKRMSDAEKRYFAQAVSAHTAMVPMAA